MKAWKLAPRRLACGYDPQCWIEENTPYLERSGSSYKGDAVWVSIRCERHAGEPVGVIQAPLVRPQPTQSTAKPLRWLANRMEQKLRGKVLPMDIRMRAAGRDE